MNGFDIFIIIAVSFGLIRGCFRGFIKEVSSIIGVIAGFYGAYTYHKQVAVYLKPWVSNFISNWESYGNIISLCLLFFLIVSITRMIANIIKRFLKVLFLKWVDKLFGSILGAIKGFLVASVVFLISVSPVLTAFLSGQPEFITKSTLAPYVAHVSDMIIIFISKEVKGDLKIKIEGLKEIWKQKQLSIQGKIQQVKVRQP